MTMIFLTPAKVPKVQISNCRALLPVTTRSFSGPSLFIDPTVMNDGQERGGGRARYIHDLANEH